MRRPEKTTFIARAGGRSSRHLMLKTMPERFIVTPESTGCSAFAEHDSSASFACSVLLFKRREHAFVLQRIEQAQIDKIADVPADIGKLFEDVLRAFARRHEVLRRLLLEVVVGDVEDFRILDLQL